MTDKTLENIKIILEKRDLANDYFDLKALPPEEAKIFLASINVLPQHLAKFDSPPLDKNETKRWSLIYLALHNLFHSEINHQDITKLEILTTAPIFNLTKEFLNEEDLVKLSFAYFLLGFTSLRINHSLEYLISEKLILGEFVAIGGIESSIWGLKFKHHLLQPVAQNILTKVEKDRHDFLVKKYKNIVFDFL
ncbi:MAG: hypothetical protein KatS3mg096_148 [Candidatus Parcubacteria bacterium]|nr:MAG: hypothetical protein KatS3mg096_148 [Candidatus Parcubacteria bacterium]